MTVRGKTVPLVKGHPVVGSMPELLSGHIPALVEMMRQDGEVVHVKAGPPGMRLEVYGVFSPGGVQDVLTTKAASFSKDGPTYSQMRGVMGTYLLTSQGEARVRQRRILQPLFSNRAVADYADLIPYEVDHLTNGGDGGMVDVYEAASEFSLRILARGIFGADVGPIIDVYRRTVPYLTSFLLRRAVQPVSTPLSWPVPANRRARACLEEIYTAVDAVIGSRRASPNAAASDMIGLLTRAHDEHGHSLSDVEIRDQVRGFLVTGKETIGATVAFALYALGNHPEIQEKCRAEVATLLGDRHILASDVARLPYLTAVVKETLRLYAAAPLSERVAISDTTIDGFHIPAGSNVWLSALVSHRNPRYWPDPDRFDPDRFAEGQELTRPRFAYHPFGGGGDSCIGQYFSMLQVVLALAHVLRDFEVETIDRDVAFSYGISVVPGGPLRCRITPLRGRARPR